MVDLGSHNGTYVNGSRVERAALSEDDIISIGPATFRLANDELREYVDRGDVSLEARGLRVIGSGGKVLLEDVSFPVPERCLLAVIGPRGAGKSTLLGALTGIRPADTGTVLHDNRDLYQDYAELRHRIGFVPQRDILHTQLTARAALGYAAELRFPSDTGKDERTRWIDEVLGARAAPARRAARRGAALAEPGTGADHGRRAGGWGRPRPRSGWRTPSPTRCGSTPGHLVTRPRPDAGPRGGVPAGHLVEAEPDATRPPPVRRIGEYLPQGVKKYLLAVIVHQIPDFSREP